MRSEIHKLKPEDLEETIIEKPTNHPGTNGPNENQYGDWNKMSTLICREKTYRILLSISKKKTQKKSLSISLIQCICIILQMNN
jgi:hypothetical protein